MDAGHYKYPCAVHIKSDLFCYRYLSRWDIQVALRSGCPSIDRKVVNSGKRLRAHVGLDEGEVSKSKYVKRNFYLLRFLNQGNQIPELPNTGKYVKALCVQTILALRLS
jgi:hypothetical protein